MSMAQESSAGTMFLLFLCVCVSVIRTLLMKCNNGLAVMLGNMQANVRDFWRADPPHRKTKITKK